MILQINSSGTPKWLDTDTINQGSMGFQKFYMVSPISKTTAARKPFVILVSINTKKTGPIIKAKKKPSGIAA